MSYYSDMAAFSTKLNFNPFITPAMTFIEYEMQANILLNQIKHADEQTEANQKL